jgi:glycosyltransferase involved in cell wall biosynthesis
MLNKSISVVLPVYNEEGNIHYVIDSIMDTLASVTGDFEIIAVDDGSADSTDKILKDIKVSCERLKVVRHPRNIGYGAALRSGFKQAEKDLIFFMDADRQFEVSEIKKLLPFIEDYDIVAAFRIRRNDPIYRLVLGFCFNFIMRILFPVKIKDINCGFKLLRSGWLKKINLTTHGALINTEMMSLAHKNKLKVKQAGVNHYPRIYGRQTGGSLKIVCRAAFEIVKLKLKLWGLTS